MSFTKQVTLWCDGCNEWMQVPGNLADARGEGKRLGWTSFREDDRTKDFCRLCSSKRRKRLKAENRLKRGKGEDK